jgi:hypothetical protein
MNIHFLFFLGFYTFICSYCNRMILYYICSFQFWWCNNLIAAHHHFDESMKIFCKYFYITLHRIAFILPFDIETVFNLSSIVMNKERKVSFRVSIYVKSEKLSLIINAIKYSFDDFINFACPIIISPNFGSLLFSSSICVPLSYRCPC